MNLPPVVRWATGIRWQWKVFIPIIVVLLLSIVAIASVLETLGIHEAQIILLASVCFAILLCFVLLSVLLVLVERPLEDLMDTIARVRGGDLSARVAFAKRRDDIGQLGRQFNEMVEQLERNRGEIEELHRREMGRAEHLATLGELAAGRSKLRSASEPAKTLGWVYYSAGHGPRFSPQFSDSREILEIPRSCSFHSASSHSAEISAALRLFSIAIFIPQT